MVWKGALALHVQCRTIRKKRGHNRCAVSGMSINMASEINGVQAAVSIRDRSFGPEELDAAVLSKFEESEISGRCAMIRAWLYPQAQDRKRGALVKYPSCCRSRA